MIPKLVRLLDRLVAITVRHYHENVLISSFIVITFFPPATIIDISKSGNLLSKNRENLRTEHVSVFDNEKSEMLTSDGNVQFFNKVLLKVKK